MKNVFSIAVCTLLLACQSAPSGDETTTTEKQNAANTEGTQYQISTANSTIEWMGAKLNGRHNGTFALEEGTIRVKDNQISGGSFTINLEKLTCLDLSGEDKSKLEGHLKSADFFDVAKYPTALFEITNITPYSSENGQSVVSGANVLISGNLTLKDSTKNVTFPAAVTITDTIISANAAFTIDRTEWGLNYKGPNNPQDWFIKKEVDLKLAIQAKR